MFERNVFISALMVLSCILPSACSRRSAAPPPATDRARPTADTSGSSEQKSPAAQMPDSPLVQKAGRALSAGDVSVARQLVEQLGDSPAAQLVKARIARRTGQFEEAIRIYHTMTDTAPSFESQRVMELAETLAEAGRPSDAADQIRFLIDNEKAAPASRRLLLMKRRAGWLMDAKKPSDAAGIYLETVEIAAKPKEKDGMRVLLASALIASGEKDKAYQLLSKLALYGESGTIMTDAHKALVKLKRVPTWSVDQRLERARRLLGFKSYGEATKTLEPIQGGSAMDEADWLSARILFKKRRHYKEAIQALTPIASKKGSHADDARFLLARALSRVDRDEEAIVAYRRYAKRTPNRGKALEALFLASRLEFYLGKHRQALNAIEQLVGTGRPNQKTKITQPGRKRDAHFLAGLSAILIDKPKNAEPHLVAASKGSSHREVLERNSYWLAVARDMAKKERAADDYRAICEKDATSWYSLLARRRLGEKNVNLGPCAGLQLGETGSGKKAVKTSSDTIAEPLLALQKVSPLAALFAQAGFFREAAEVLRGVEKRDKVQMSAAEWIAQYMNLEAPHYAIRRASVALTWPPDAESLWLAEAAYPTPYKALVKEMEEKHALPSLLLYAIMRKESLFDPSVVSRVGAMGLMQMMPRTYETNRKRAGLTKLKEGELPGPEDSIRAASEEFADLFKRFDNSLPLVIMAYNGGPHAVDRWLERSGDLPLDVFVEKAGFVETRNYVRRVIRNLVRYRQLSGEPMPELPLIAARPKTK